MKTLVIKSISDTKSTDWKLVKSAPIVHSDGTKELGSAQFIHVDELAELELVVGDKLTAMWDK